MIIPITTVLFRPLNGGTETMTASGDPAAPDDPRPPDDVAGLVARAAAGDQQAWDAIVGRFTALLWSVGRAHRLDQDVIVDVVQMTWLRLLENLGTIREPERLAGWLATTARRECLAVLRRAGREQPGWDDDAMLVADETLPAIDQLLLADERDAQLWGCFRRLTERCQRLLRVLMVAEPTSYADISVALGLPVGSIGPTRMRCLDRLRSLLVATGYPFDVVTGGGAA